MFNQQNKVSVVMPIGAWSVDVLKSINSALMQGEYLGELLLVDNDDISYSDRSLDYHLADSRIEVIRSEVVRNAAIARNLGMKLAKFQFISVLDSDDEYLRDHLKNAVATLKRTQSDLYFCSYMNIGCSGDSKIVRPNKKFNVSSLLSKVSLGHSTMVLRKDIARPYPVLKRRHDYGLWLILAREYGDGIYCCDRNFVGVVRNQRYNSLSSVSRIDLFFIQYRVARNYSGKGIVSVSILYLIYIFKYVLKRVLKGLVRRFDFH